MVTRTPQEPPVAVEPLSLVAGPAELESDLGRQFARLVADAP